MASLLAAVQLPLSRGTLAHRCVTAAAKETIFVDHSLEARANHAAAHSVTLEDFMIKMN